MLFPVLFLDLIQALDVQIIKNFEIGLHGGSFQLPDLRSLRMRGFPILDYITSGDGRFLRTFSSHCRDNPDDVMRIKKTFYQGGVYFIIRPLQTPVNQVRWDPDYSDPY